MLLKVRSIVLALGLLAVLWSQPGVVVAGTLRMEVSDEDGEVAETGLAGVASGSDAAADVEALEADGDAVLAGGTADGAEGSEVAEVAISTAAAPPAPVTVPDLIVDAAERYGLSSERMLRIGWCESRWDPSARGPGGAAGVFQFVPNTWSWASAGAGVGGQSPYDAAANVEAAAWVMATQGYHHWGCR